MPVNESAVQRALDLITKNPANYAYFFGQLKDPEWIAPLRDAGRFRYPPTAVRQPGTIAFPAWPEGDYLVRMAGLRPELVKDVLIQVPVSDNARIHQYAFEAAVEMPPTFAAEVARREAKWVGEQTSLYMLLPQRIADVVKHLVAGSEANTALALTQAVLRLRAGQEDRSRNENTPQWRPPADPLPQLTIWDYDSFVRDCIPALIEQKPYETFRFLCAQLDFGMKIHRGEGAGIEDFSSIWMPSLEYGHLPDIKGSLVVAVRDAALEIAKSRQGLDLVLTALRKYNWRIFRRLEHFVLSKSSVTELSDVTNALQVKDNFSSRRTDPEFHSLLIQWLPKVPASVQETVVNILSEGLDYSIYRTRLELQGQSAPEIDKLVVRSKQAWQEEWLRDLKVPLPPDLAKIREEMNDSQQANATRLVMPGVRRGQPTPLSASDILAMGVKEFTNYISDWKPREEFGEPNKAGLGDTLRQAITEGPERLSGHLRALIGGEPTYVRSAIDGLSYAVSLGKKVDAELALDLALYGITQATQENSARGEAWDQDPGWNWTAKSVGMLLVNMLAKEESLPLDIACRTRIWSIIELIMQPGNATDSSTDSTSDAEEPTSISLDNDARTEGIEAAVRYGLWVRSRVPDLTAGRAGLPEVFDLLDRAVDPGAQTTRGIREALGHWLPQISYLDDEWLGEKEPQLFPPEEQLYPIYRFTWQSFIVTTHAFTAVFRSLRASYLRAITLMQSWPEKVRKDVNAGLARHLIRIYAWGIEPDNSEIMRGFFASASDDALEQGFRDVGFGTHGSKDKLDEPTQQRLMRLWESRLEAAEEKPSAHRGELSAFGFWFASDALPVDWQMQTLNRLLSIIKTVNPSHLVVKKLADVCGRDPLSAVESLRYLVEGDTEGYEVYGWDDNPKIILAAALDGGEASAEEARLLIEQLIVRGHHSYRTLLTKSRGARS
jgi:hypothetical protein